MNRKPILVTGSNRAGTTWVGKMLSLSQYVHYIGEFFNPHESSRHLNQGRIERPFQYVGLRDEADLAEAFSGCLNYSYAPQRSKSYYRLLPSRLHLYRLSRRLLGLPRPLIKDPFAPASAEWLTKNFHMSVVCIIRHPAAIVASIRKAGWYGGYEFFARQPELVRDHLQQYAEQLENDPRDEVESAAWRWLFTYQILLNYYDRHPEWYMIRLEDLSAAPGDGFRRLFSALDVPYSPRICRQILKYSSIKNPDNAPSDNPHLIRRNSKAAQQQWRRILTLEEIRRIRKITEPLAHKFYGGSDW